MSHVGQHCSSTWQQMLQPNAGVLLQHMTGRHTDISRHLLHCCCCCVCRGRCCCSPGVHLSCRLQWPRPGLHCCAAAPHAALHAILHTSALLLTRYASLLSVATPRSALLLLHCCYTAATALLLTRYASVLSVATPRSALPRPSGWLACWNTNGPEARQAGGQAGRQLAV
jgi:hypothetical protein